MILIFKINNLRRKKIKSSQPSNLIYETSMCYIVRILLDQPQLLPHLK
jgi:hypothetical protein